MIKHTVTYEDFNGNTQTEDLYFHMSKAAAARFSSFNNDTLELLREVAGDPNRNQEELPMDLVHMVIDLLNDLIAQSYGTKSPDGKRFIRFVDDNPAMEFFTTAAYEALFEDLISDETKMTNFVTALIGETQTAQPPAA